MSFVLGGRREEIQRLEKSVDFRSTLEERVTIGE